MTFFLFYAEEQKELVQDLSNELKEERLRGQELERALTDEKCAAEELRTSVNALRPAQARVSKLEEVVRGKQWKLLQ